MAIDVVANMKARVGRQNKSDGDDALPWAGRQADLITQPFGKYYQAALQGYVRIAVTTDAGVAPGTDSAGTTQAVSLYNPNGSGVNLVILKAAVAYVSGTLGAGEMLWTANTNPASAATTGTNMAQVNGMVSLGTGGGGSPLQASTVPEAPTLMFPFCSLDALLASSVIGIGLFTQYIDGAIIVPPGCRVGMAADAAAGSTPLVSVGLMWAAVPV